MRERLRLLLTSAEVSADLAYGALVPVTARWILIVAALVLAFWDPSGMQELRAQSVMLLALAAGNFYLHARLLMGRPPVDGVLYAASAADVAVISLLVLTEHGAKSNIYVFYFPALLAVSVAVPTIVTLAVTGAAVVLYAIIGLATLTSAADGQVLVARLLMLAAVAFCGNLYQRIERTRRADAAEGAAAEGTVSVAASVVDVFIAPAGGKDVDVAVAADCVKEG